ESKSSFRKSFSFTRNNRLRQLLCATPKLSILISSSLQMKRSYYSNSVGQFLKDDETKILGELSLHHLFALEELQKNAWLKQIRILKDSLAIFDQGRIYFEFLIPRMGKRVDNILFIDGLIFVIEFKFCVLKYK